MDEEPVRGGFADPSLLALGGLDRIRAGVAGHAPNAPIHHLFGLDLVAVGPASATCAVPASPWLCSDAGVFHSGAVALAADAALAFSIQATLGPGAVVATSDLSFNFLRPASPASRRLICRARPIDVGDSLGLAEATVEDGSGRLLAHATTRCFVVRFPVPPIPDPLPAPTDAVYPTPDPHERPAPMPGAAGWGRRSIAAVMAAKRRGELRLAPCSELLGAFDPAAHDGTAGLSVHASPWLAGPSGTLYGGVLALLLDIVMTGAASTTHPSQAICSPLDLKVQFVRPVWPDGRPLRATGRVVHHGKRFATAGGRIVDGDGTVVALAMSSFVVVGGRTWANLTIADDASPEVAPRP